MSHWMSKVRWVCNLDAAHTILVWYNETVASGAATFCEAGENYWRPLCGRADVGQSTSRKLSSSLAAWDQGNDKERVRWRERGWQGGRKGDGSESGRGAVRCPPVLLLSGRSLSATKIGEDIITDAISDRGPPVRFSP